MGDRELLELAAKAAGLRARWNREVNCMRLLPGKKTPYGMTYSYWDPLADDGAALRLAVKLGLRVVCHPALNQTIVREYHATENEWTENCEDHIDPDAATRRAITRAAAEIGKTQTKEGPT